MDTDDIQRMAEKIHEIASHRDYKDPKAKADNAKIRLLALQIDMLAENLSGSEILTAPDLSNTAANTDLVVDTVDTQAAANDVPSGTASDAAMPNEIEPSEQTAPMPSDQVITADLSPLSSDILADLSAIPWDAEPEVLNAVEKFKEGNHFPFSDEKHPDLFRESLAGKGGTYIGVGTDQAYLFIGWLRPTMAFAIDYDPWAVYTNMGYLALFKTCDDIACFSSKLKDKDAMRDWLLEYYADHPLKKEISKRFRSVLYGVSHRFYHLKQQEYPNFANDPETYQYIRDMARSGRLVVHQANLLDTKAIHSISAFLKKYHQRVTAFYVSNAEQYWNYTKEYKDNMKDVPWADNGFIMRTQAVYPRNNDYKYSIQTAKAFMAWLDDPRATNVKKIIKKVSVHHFDEFPFTVDDLLPGVPESPDEP